jgi:hypothetical protein
MVVEGPSPIILGTAQWGMPYGIANFFGIPDHEEINEILQVARRAGVDTIDTARAYGDSEATIGELTQGDDYWTIITKLDPGVLGSQSSLEETLVRVEESIAESLTALKREKLDVLLLHRAEHRHALEGAIWQRLCEKRASGEITALGVSVGSPKEASILVEDPSVDVLQVAASLLDQRLLVSGFFARAKELEKRVFVRSIFLQGVAHLEPEALPPYLADLNAPLETIKQWALAREISPSDAWLLFARDGIRHPIVIGCESTGQLCQNLMTWRSLQVPPMELIGLAGEVRNIEESLLDPAGWNQKPKSD